MIYPKIPLAQSIIQICLNKNIKNIVISPGSRNAPLTIGFVKNTKFTCYSIVDERCAAFFALGIAQQTKQTVALVCTSGSALLNYYPAIAEAFYSQIPLVIISADRPLNKIDIGDGQTIRQQNVFENHILYNANLIEKDCLENDIKINNALIIAQEKKGPVHINAPFEEPLYETVSEPKTNTKFVKETKQFKLNFINDIQHFVDIWNTSTRKLILIGNFEPNNISKEILNAWANDPSIVVMTEITSNIHHPNFISNIDTIITPFKKEDFENFKPEILITFGGMIVSKRIKNFLRDYKAKHHWHIDPLRAYNTFGILSEHIKTTVSEFFNIFLPLTTTVFSNYFYQIDKIRKLRARKQDVFFEKMPFSDFKVFEKIAKKLPKNTHIQVSNSTAIRYLQLVSIHPSIEVYCNRGTSGIDGSTSTAIGAAISNNKQTILITGDISFFYDSNALWNSYIPKNFKIILINNNGGGIFRILPGHEDTPVFNTFFETTHQLTAKYLAKMYDFDYQTAIDEKSLETSLKNLFKNNNKPNILEIFTPKLKNNIILKDFFKSI